MYAEYMLAAPFLLRQLNYHGDVDADNSRVICSMQYFYITESEI
jgi:hypothetical protein